MAIVRPVSDFISVSLIASGAWSEMNGISPLMPMMPVVRRGYNERRDGLREGVTTTTLDAQVSSFRRGVKTKPNVHVPFSIGERSSDCAAALRGCSSHTASRSALACAAWVASPPETRAVARRKSALTLAGSASSATPAHCAASSHRSSARHACAALLCRSRRSSRTASSSLPESSGAALSCSSCSASAPQRYASSASSGAPAARRALPCSLRRVAWSRRVWQVCCSLPAQGVGSGFGSGFDQGLGQG